MGNTHHASYPAVPASVAVARNALASLAAAAGATEQQTESVRLAVSEVLTNVVLHAYAGEPGKAQVTAAVVANELWILIADEGRGLQARTDSPGLGVGLVLVSQVADDFAVVSRAAGGTEVRLRFNLGEGGASAAALAGIRQPRGSEAAASRPASARFSTTT